MGFPLFFKQTNEEQLCTACSQGDLPAVKKLTSAKKTLDLNHSKKKERRASPFFIACFYGHLGVVQFLSSLPKINLNQAVEGGFTPFWIACQNNHLEVVRFLSSLPQVDPQIPEKGGISPFFVACGKGHKPLVRFLASLPQIDLNQPSLTGATPFLYACRNGDLELVRFLANHERISPNTPQNDGASPFLAACEKGRAEVVAYLSSLDRIDINLPKYDGATPLWMAAQNNHLGVAKAILSNPKKLVDVQRVCQWNNTTAWQRARERGNHVVADLIESYQKNPRAVSFALSKELGTFDYYAAEVFALMIFHSDDLLTLKESA